MELPREREVIEVIPLPEPWEREPEPATVPAEPVEHPAEPAEVPA